MCLVCVLVARFGVGGRFVGGVVAVGGCLLRGICDGEWQANFAKKYVQLYNTASRLRRLGIGCIFSSHRYAYNI